MHPPAVKTLLGVSAQEFCLQKEKVRVYALAKELNVESKDLLDLCRQAGFDVKNQLSSLDPEQRDAVEVMIRKGGGVAVAAPPPKPAVSTIPTIPTPVPVLPSRSVRREPEPAKPMPTSTPLAAGPTAAEPRTTLPPAPVAKAPESIVAKPS